MSAFFAGQRVKLVRPGKPQRISFTGTILGLFDDRMGFTYPVNCDVSWDQPLPENTSSETHTSRLEPILPSGQVAVTLEQLLSVPGLESLDKILGVKV